MLVTTYTQEVNIISQYEKSDKLFFSSIGKLNVFQRQGNSKIVHINTITPGKIFGEIGLICDTV